MFFSLSTADATGWKAGFAKVSITPEEPVVLLGYSDRRGPFTSVDLDIFAKAMAIEDASGHRGVIVTTDLVGIQDTVFSEVCEQVHSRTGLSRDQLILNASHNHTGPLVSLNPIERANIAHPDMTNEDVQRTIEYTRTLQEKVEEIILEALSNLQPAALSHGKGQVGFVMNRRVIRPEGVVMAPNPDGPVDPVVPVLKVEDREGKLLGVLFGCACHNTTLTGAHNVISGDYAGYAQKILEEKHPNLVALFMSGCGADANPEPRGKLSQAKMHGRELATEVERIIQNESAPLSPRLETVYEEVDLPLLNLERPEVEEYAAKPNSQGLMAKQMLRVLEAGASLPRSYGAPIVVWQFGNHLSLLALPAEGVAEYAHSVQELFPGHEMWVSSYNNDCFGYLPSAQIAAEGGHEDIGITLWIWGKHLAENVGFFAPEVEEVVLKTAKRIVEGME